MEFSTNPSNPRSLAIPTVIMTLLVTLTTILLKKVLTNPFFKNLFFILFYSSFSVEDCDLLEVRVHASSFVYPLERYLAQYMFVELNQITSLSKVFFISFKRRKKTYNLKLFFGFPWFALEYGISEVFSLLLFSFIFFSENVFSQAIELYCVPKQ